MDGRHRFEIDQVRAAGAACPGCGHQGLDLRLLCEPGESCLRAAVCEDCGIAYHVREGEFSSQIESLLPNLVCGSCGHVGAHVGIVCDVPSHVCDPTVICNDCRNPFTRAETA
jgi:hypothetical protein